MAITLTVIAMMIPEPGVLMYVLLFPSPVALFLLSIVGGGENRIIVPTLSLAFGWAVYVALISSALLTANSFRFRRILFLLSVVLLLNVVGCKGMFYAGNQIRINCERSNATPLANR